jgi:hypothetical protein
VGKEVDESRAVFFINMVRVETAKFISTVDFKDIFRNILFPTMWEFPIDFPWGESGEFYQ